MRARAFQAWAQREPRSKLRVQMARPLESTHSLYRFGVGLYNWIQRTAPKLHHLYFNFLEVVPVVHRTKPLGAERYRVILEDYRPDVLLSTHPKLNHGYFEFARKVLGRDNVRCVTYCGELHGGYGFSRHWVNPDADLFIGAVPETCEAAEHLGMPSKRAVVGGFLLRPSFYEEEFSAEARREYVRRTLQFDPGQFLLLLSASSRGANNHVPFLNALKKQKVGAQVAALCGKSAATEKEVADWAAANPSFPLRVLPHNTDVAKLLQCASAVVARPGTGATSEAIVSRCPLLLNGLGGIMPQEWITVKYCRKYGLAQTIKRPNELARLVARWIENPDLIEAARQRMNAVRPKSNPRGIVQAVTGGA